MPSRTLLDEDLWFLYQCVQNSDYKSIDFKLVGKATNIKSRAARIHFIRLSKAIENGPLIDTHGKPSQGSVGKQVLAQKKRKRRADSDDEGDNEDSHLEKRHLNVQPSFAKKKPKGLTINTNYTETAVKREMIGNMSKNRKDMTHEDSFLETLGFSSPDYTQPPYRERLPAINTEISTLAVKPHFPTSKARAQASLRGLTIEPGVAAVSYPEIRLIHNKLPSLTSLPEDKKLANKKFPSPRTSAAEIKQLIHKNPLSSPHSAPEVKKLVHDKLQSSLTFVSEAKEAETYEQIFATSPWDFEGRED